MKKLSLLVLPFLLSSCAFYLKPKEVSLYYPKEFKENLKIADTKINKNWWETFNDKDLNYFINLALKNNPDYKIALKNIEIAKTYVLQNGSYLFPMFNLQSTSQRQKFSQRTPTGKFIFSKPYTTYDLSVSASYELDLFGKALNAFRASKENVQLSKDEAKAVKIALITNVVNNYYQIVQNAKQIEILRKEIAILKENEKLTEANYKAGLTNYSNVYSSKLALRTLKENLKSLENERKILINAFAYLLGEYPESFKFSIEGAMPKNLEIPKAVPSYVVANRPDIRETQKNIIIDAYSEKISLANFFPSFNLTGSYGFESNKLTNLITTPSVAWNFGLNILEPIINYGSILAQYKRSKLQLQEDILNYRKTVLNAFKEVDDSLSNYKTDYLIYKLYKKDYEENLKNYDIALANYKAGLINYQALSSYKINYLNSYSKLLAEELKLVQDISSFYNVIGF